MKLIAFQSGPYEDSEAEVARFSPSWRVSDVLLQG